jgi:hypothetical protein
LVGREIWSYTQPSKFSHSLNLAVYCFTFKSLLLEDSPEMGKRGGW